MKKNYKLRYLPLFYEDLKETVEYISFKLSNQNAALKLLDDVENAIIERLSNADSYESYKSLKNRQTKYYYIKIRNFMIFYVVLCENDEYIMEVRRFLHKDRY